jgi:hypothetical protein
MGDDYHVQGTLKYNGDIYHVHGDIYHVHVYLYHGIEDI